MVNNRSGCSGRSVKKYLTVKHSILVLGNHESLGITDGGQSPCYAVLTFVMAVAQEPHPPSVNQNLVNRG
jgi:hypothetical protein